MSLAAAVRTLTDELRAAVLAAPDLRARRLLLDLHAAAADRAQVALLLLDLPADAEAHVDLLRREVELVLRLAAVGLPEEPARALAVLSEARRQLGHEAGDELATRLLPLVEADPSRVRRECALAVGLGRVRLAEVTP